MQLFFPIGINTINTTMGNMDALQSNMAAWQGNVVGASVVVGDSGQIEVQHASVDDVDFDQAMANIRSYVPSATTAGGAAIKFIFQTEINRCNAAIQSVASHEQVFQSVIGNVEAIAKLRELTDALNEFHTQAETVADEAENMRREAQNFGADLDERLQQQGVMTEGREAIAPNMMLMAALREAAVYNQNAHEVVTEVINDIRETRDSLRLWKSGSSASTDLNRVRKGSRMIVEINRYQHAVRAYRRLQQFIAQRSQHLQNMLPSFTSALGGRGFTDGRDRF